MGCVICLQGAIYDYFDSQHPGTFTKFDGLAPVVAAKAVSWRERSAEV